MFNRNTNTIELDQIRDAQSGLEQEMLRQALMEMARSGRPLIVQECGDIVHICRGVGDIERLLETYWGVVVGGTLT